jgi:hypothetical protein
METMQAFLDLLKLSVPAGQVRRCRQPFEIVGMERRCLICTPEGFVGVTPRAAPVRLTAVFKIHLKPRMLIVCHDFGSPCLHANGRWR